MGVISGKTTSSSYETLQTSGHTGQLAVVLFYKTENARKSISYLGYEIWNDLNQDIKTSSTANSFKHPLRRSFFKS